jgi:hypothetical protein
MPGQLRGEIERLQRMLGDAKGNVASGANVEVWSAMVEAVSIDDLSTTARSPLRGLWRDLAPLVGD